MAKSPYERPNPLRLITPITSVPSVKAIAELRPEEAIQPIAKYSGLQDKRKTYENLVGHSFVANYNDPTELNSYIDALTNRAAVSKRFGEAWGTASTLSGTIAVIGYAVAGLATLAGVIAAPFTAGTSAGAGAAVAAKVVAASSAIATTAKTVATVASIPAIPAAVDVTYNYGIKPIAAGKWKEAGVNTLMNLGETMDYAANPVKGAILEGGEGFVKGLGLGDSGRTNYDFDTGNFITDVLAEMLVDPTNWLQFGTNVASKNVAKKAVTSQVDNMVTKLVTATADDFAKFGIETTTDGLAKMKNRLIKDLSKDALRYTGTGLEEQALNLAKKKMTAIEWLNPANKELRDRMVLAANQEIQKQFQHRLKTYTLKAFKEGYPDLNKAQLEVLLSKTAGYTTSIISNTGDLILDSTAANVVKGLQGLASVTEGFDRAMSKAALRTSGLGLGMTGVKTLWDASKQIQRGIALSKNKAVNSITNYGDVNVVNLIQAEADFSKTAGHILLATGEVSEYNTYAFQEVLRNQLRRDDIFINEVLTSGNAITRATRLDSAFLEHYGVNFDQYVKSLKEYSEFRGGYLQNRVSRLEYTRKLLVQSTVADFSTGLDSVSKAVNPNTIYGSALKQAQRLNEESLKLGFNPEKSNVSINVIKLDNAVADQMFLNNEVLRNTFNDINSNEGTGAVFRNLLEDPVFKESVDVEVYQSVKDILDIATSFENNKMLRTHLSLINIPENIGVNGTKLKQAYLGVLAGYWTLTPAEALAKLDTIHNAIWSTLEYQYKTSFLMFPEMQEQFKLALHNFILAQMDSNAVELTSSVGQRFTKTVTNLKNSLEEYPNLQELLRDDIDMLEQAAVATEITASQIREINESLGQYWFSNEILYKEPDVFSLLYGTKSNIGTVGYQEIFNTDALEMFEELNGTLPINYAKQLADLSEKITRYQNSVKQTYIFTEARARTLGDLFRPKNQMHALEAAYDKIYKLIISSDRTRAVENVLVDGNKIKQYSPFLSNISPYTFLREALEPKEMYAQLQAVWEILKNTDNSKELRQAFITSFVETDTYGASYGKQVLRYIQQPHLLQASPDVTDPMIRQTTLSNRRIMKDAMTVVDRADAMQTDILNNGIKSFDDYTNKLVEYKQNNSLAKLHERQVTPLRTANELATELDSTYRGLYNTTIAEENINFLNSILEESVELNERWGDTVTLLDNYYKGLHVFETQEPFEAFWDKIKKMNTDIAEYQKSQFTEEYLRSLIQAKYSPNKDFYKKWFRNEEDINNIINLYNQVSLTDAEEKTIREFLDDAYMSSTHIPASRDINDIAPNNMLPDTAKRVVENPFVVPKYVTPWDASTEQRAFNKVLYAATDAQQTNAASRLLRSSVEDIQTELAYRGRIVTIGGLTHDKAFNNNLSAFKRYYSKNKHLFDEKGIYVLWDENKLTLVLGKEHSLSYKGGTVFLNGNALTRKEVLSSFTEMEAVDAFLNNGDKKFTNKINKYHKELEEVTGRSLGDSQGDLLTSEAYQKIYDTLPDEIKNSLPDFDTMVQELKDAPAMFNESLFGSIGFKNAITGYNGDIISNLKNSANQMYMYTRAKSEYIHTLLDSTSSIGHPESIFNQFTDQELLDALRFKDDYRLVALVEDARYGAKVVEIYPTSVAELAKARALNANIVPLNVYKSLYNTINHRIGSANKFMKIFSSIMYKWKGGALMRTGAFVRNIIDTHTKTGLDIGSETVMYSKKAHKLIEDYDGIRRALINLSNEGAVTRDAIEQYFKTMKTPFDLDVYDELTEFFSEGVASVTIRGKSELINPGNNPVTKTLNKMDEMVGGVIEWGNSPEAYNRLAVHLSNIDKGLTYSQSLKRISDVHFDYMFRNKFAQIAELVLPFVTFKALNMQLWVDLLDKHPWLLRQYANVLTPAWDFNKYTPEQIANSQALQNKILGGYIPLFTSENGESFNIKLGFSVIDAITTMTNPLMFLENLNPYLRAANDLVTTGTINNPIQLIPQIGIPLQTATTAIKQLNPVPSLIGKQYPQRQYSGYQKKTSGTVSPYVFKNNNLRKANMYRDGNRTPRYRQNSILDPYKTIGAKQYRARMYPLIDIAYEVRSRTTSNVYGLVKARVTTDVYKGIRYRMRLDVNKFR